MAAYLFGVIMHLSPKQLSPKEKGIKRLASISHHLPATFPLTSFGDTLWSFEFLFPVEPYFSSCTAMYFIPRKSPSSLPPSLISEYCLSQRQYYMFTTTDQNIG